MSDKILNSNITDIILIKNNIRKHKRTLQIPNNTEV